MIFPPRWNYSLMLVEATPIAVLLWFMVMLWMQLLVVRNSSSSSSSSSSSICSICSIYGLCSIIIIIHAEAIPSWRVFIFGGMTDVSEGRGSANTFDYNNIRFHVYITFVAWIASIPQIWLISRFRRVRHPHRGTNHIKTNNVDNENEQHAHNENTNKKHADINRCVYIYIYIYMVH